MHVISEFVFDSVTSQRIGWTILHSLWQISLLAVSFGCLRWLISRGTHQPSAAAIYWAGCVTLGLMAAAPVATFLTLEPIKTEVASNFELNSEAREQIANEMVIGSSESRFILLSDEKSPSETSTVQVSSADLGRVPDDKSNTNTNGFLLAIQTQLPRLTSIWLIGVALFLIRPLLGLCNIQRLKASCCSKLSQPIKDAANRAVERTGIRRAVRFATSKKIEVPTVVGFWRPIVMFPLSALTELTPAQLELIIVHELAHIRRHDYLVNLVQTIIESVLFYHPGVWWVSMIVRSERENCCDDAAIEISCVDEYARALLVLEGARSVPVPALGAHGGNLVARVRRMIDSAPTRTQHRRIPVMASVLAMAVLAMLLVAGQWTSVAKAAVQATQEKQIENPTKIRKDFAKTTIGKVLSKEMEKLKQVGFSGSILVAHKGEIILAKSEGFIDPKGKKRAKPHTLYEIASFSKSFTSTAAMILAEQGKLDLDASIDKYLPGVPNDCKPITVRHLMQHTSGMPRDNYGETNKDLETAVKTMLAGGPQTDPGTEHAYWNQGYILLSEVIAKAAEKSFTSVVKELIFEPCEMTGSCFTGDKAPGGFQVSTGTGKLGPPRTCLEHPYGKLELVYQGTGGIVTNVFDIWKFHKALQDNELMSEKSKAEMFDTASVGNYALGWRIGETSSGKMRQSHGGSVRGFTCSFARFPESDSCIVVLSNNDAAPAATVANVIEGILMPPDMPNKLDAALAKKCLGDYKDAKGRLLQIEQVGESLTYAIFWGAGNPEAPVSRGYVLKGEDGSTIMYQPGDSDSVDLVFNKDESQVDSITFPKLDVVFNRAK